MQPIKKTSLYQRAAPLAEKSPINLHSKCANQISLKTIQKLNGDIREIRFLLRGNRNECYRLLQEAIIQDSSVIQIQLSFALFGMKKGKDHEKDFSFLTTTNLEDFQYYPNRFSLLSIAYSEVFQETEVYYNLDHIENVFKKASALGYFPASFELLHYQWETFHNHYVFATQLHPGVGKGNITIDYFYGLALKNGAKIGSELYYEGMSWIEQSLGTSIKYPQSNETFTCFRENCIRNEYYLNVFYESDGFTHIYLSNVIFVSSAQAWIDFKNQKLKEFIYPSPLNFECFTLRETDGNEEKG